MLSGRCDEISVKDIIEEIVARLEVLTFFVDFLANMLERQPRSFQYGAHFLFITKMCVEQHSKHRHLQMKEAGGWLNVIEITLFQLFRLQ
jgi:hypothetical protein